MLTGVNRAIDVFVLILLKVAGSQAIIIVKMVLYSVIMQ
jgi:hypothetical protein